jgi:hypothetical protein
LQQSTPQQAQQRCNNLATRRNSTATAPKFTRATAQQAPIGEAKLLRPLARIPSHPAKHPLAFGFGHSGLITTQGHHSINRTPDISPEGLVRLHMR